MAAADVVITGSVLTVDEARPTVEALAVADGRIVAVADPRAVPPEQIADLDVRATYLAGRQVYAQ